MRAYVGGPNRLLLAAVCGALVVISCGIVVPLRAQQADEPAMEKPAEDEAADQPAARDDAMENTDNAAADDLAADAAEEPAKPAAKPRATSKGPATDATAAVPDDPAVRAVLESHPQSPAELLRAIDILADLGHPDLAKAFVEQLIGQKLDAADKAALADRFRSATLIKLARNVELDPALGPFIDDLLKSAEAFRRDPKRLAAWTQQLANRDETTRAQAALALMRGREAAVAPLVNVLANPKRAGQHAMAREVLVRLDDLAIAPLLGVLESPDAALKVEVIDVLGRLRAGQAVAQLLAPLISPASTPQLRAAAATALERIAGHVPDYAEALRLLEHAARRGLEQSRVEGEAAAAPAELWHWNARKHESMPIQYDTTGASLAAAARLSRELYQLDPSHPARRRLYLTALLQAAKFRLGFDQPLPTNAGTAYAVAARHGVAVIDDLLADAMAKGYLPAATAAAQILGDIGSADLLTRSGPVPSPLARAAQHADRRLRFVAVNSILKLHPAAAFAGSSHVSDALGYFASSYGIPRVLVIHPLSDEAQKLAGLAAGLGYESDIATNGRRAFELAVASNDYEFILIHSAIDRPRVDELLAQLRRDRRTALLPIGVIAPVDDLDRIGRFAATVPRVEAFLQPQKPEEMSIFTAQVLARSARWHVAAPERKREAVAALDWLAELAERRDRVFDAARQEPAVVRALFVPELSATAATILGQSATALAQRSLVELADLPTVSLESRQAAARAAVRAMERYGILLTTPEILAQYDLYNTNAGRDSDTHAVLTTILDAIERKKVPLAGP
jgi:CheY-like chemotaxis protein